MKKLLKTYNQVLHDAGLKVSSDGYVSMPVRNKKTGEIENHPVTVKGQRLVVPTEEHMANWNWEERVAFNPLVESISRKESDVHEAFRATLNLQLNSVFGQVAAEMLAIAASTAGQANLTPDQQTYLSQMKNADEDALANFGKLLDAFPGDRALVNIYVKPSALIGGEKFTRGAIVSFPIYEALVKAKGTKVECAEKTVTIRAKDVETFKKLLEWIIPNIKEKHAHDVGSLSRLAPTMECLMKAAAAIMADLNIQIKLFTSALPENRRETFEAMEFKMEWAEVIDNLGSIAGEIREMGMLKGGQGAPLSAATPAPAPGAAPVKPGVAAAPTPAAVEPKKLISPFAGVDEVPVAPATPSAPFRPAPPPPPPAPAYPPAGHYPAPPPGYYPPQPAPAPAPVVNSSGKVDFHALVAANPQMAAATGVTVHQQGYYAGGPASPAGRVPGWAGGGAPAPAPQYPQQGGYYNAQPAPAPVPGRRSF